MGIYVMDNCKDYNVRIFEGEDIDSDVITAEAREFLNRSDVQRGLRLAEARRFAYQSGC